MILAIFLNLLVILSAYLLTKILFSKRGFVDFILSWFTFYLAQIIIVELYLGIIGQLYLPNIIFAHLIIFLIIFLIYRRKVYPSFLKPDTTFIFNNKILLFSIVIFLGFFLVKVWINLFNPPICPESYQYHLSFPATWIRNGNLNNPIVVFGLQPPYAVLTALTYYPINAELLFFWLMLPLRNAFLADIGPAPFYLIGILVIYSILRKYSIKRDTALFIGFLWALIPNIFKQIRNGTQIDVMCAVLFLLVLDNLLILNKELNLKNALLFGISLGIFLGTKTLNIFWFIALLPLCIYFSYKHLTKEHLGKFVIAFFLILLGLFLFGAFSYLRTFILTGNPFYPIKFNIFGKELFPGIIDKVTFSKIFVDWKEFSLRNLFFSEGLGLQFLVFIFPGTIIPLAFLSWMGKKREPLIEFALLFFVPFFMLGMYLFYIKAFWVRYFFPYLGMGFIAAVIFLNRFKWGDKFITFFGTICVLSSAAELAHRNELIISFILSFLLFFCLLLTRVRIINSLNRILSLKGLLIFLIIFSAFLIILNEKYNKEEFMRYPLIFKKNDAEKIEVALGWKWLNENSGEGKRIAYTGRSEFYPLFGSKIKNDVLYISVNKKPNLPHYYSDGHYRKEKNLEAWLANLKDARIDFLFVMLPYATDNESTDLKEFPIEDKWASSRPEEFRLVFSNNYTHIYKLLFK